MRSFTQTFTSGDIMLSDGGDAQCSFRPLTALGLKTLLSSGFNVVSDGTCILNEDDTFALLKYIDGKSPAVRVVPV